jgi:branched-chain amino acid transport system ATP-binding protein
MEVRGLKAGYGTVEVVHGLDLDVRAGEVVALFGPNGAGKTTTLLTLSGDLPALGGVVRWHGQATRAPLHLRARQGLGLVTEERSVFMRLTTLQNLKVSRGDADMALELFPELRSRLSLTAGMLSGGEQQMLSLARALCRRPRLLLVDELSFGLAPLAVTRLFQAVRAAANEGVGVLMVEQHIKKVLPFVDRFYVLDRGQISMSGLATDFEKQMGAIEQSYLSTAPKT